jgi:hypothetical protein
MLASCEERTDRTKDFWLAAGLSLFATAAFYFTTKATLRLRLWLDCVGIVAVLVGTQ